MKRIAFFLTAILILASELNSQVITVPADQPSIQAAIDAATDGDTVIVDEDTYYENIDFKGKAITVASRFILDGDTSHISKTIINGSQSDDPDKASVVSMRTGEDTTSVLMGFAVTGGKGSYVPNIHGDFNFAYFGGGGILIYNSGGKIVHNIVEGNHITDPDSRVRGALGCGILAAVNQNHTAVIRDNIIQNNSGTGHTGAGGGMALHGGRFVVENNVIRDNILDAAELAGGPGILFEHEFQPGTIEETLIWNNRILRNISYSENGTGYGGGIAINRAYDNLLVYNNLIIANQADYGGGIFSWNTPSCKAYNNTIVNNKAGTSGHNACADQGTRMVLFNNIIWSDTINNVEDIGFWETPNASFRLYHNILTKPPNPTYPVTLEGNSYLEPFLNSDTYEPGANSPAVGRGLDTLWMDGTLYAAPETDINGDPRPADNNLSIDIGAIQTDLTQPAFANADLAIAGMAGHILDPPFNSDTLSYLLVKNQGTTKIGDWYIHAADALAIMEIDTAADLLSENEVDRTTTILITSMDGTKQKEYVLVYKYLSSDASLASLEVSLGTLMPFFDPLVTEYQDTIPWGVRVPVPEVICIASDSSATVNVQPALDIYNQFEVARTTTIYVTAPNNITKQEYTIIFTVDMTRPEMSLVQDSVESGDIIALGVSEACQVYLVPENTPAIYDSIVNMAFEMVEAEISDTALISTEELDAEGAYWLYACDRHQSISEYQTLTIYAVEDTSTSVTEYRGRHIQVYPSPVTQTLYIHSPHPVESAELYDMLGKPVMKVSKPEGQIDLGHLSEGIYFVRLITEKDRIYITRIIKN